MHNKKERERERERQNILYCRDEENGDGVEKKSEGESGGKGVE